MKISRMQLVKISEDLDVTISPSQDGTQLIASVHHDDDMRWLVSRLAEYGYQYGVDFQNWQGGLTINWSGI